MNRVSDAMRRAGQIDEEQTALPADGMPFSSAEDPTEAPVIYPRPDVLRTDVQARPDVRTPSESDSTHMAPPVRTDYGIPSEVIRTAPGQDVAIFDVMRTLYRRRWLMAAVIVASLASAAAYNQVATRFYQARARVLIEPNTLEVAPFRQSMEDQGRADYFVTQLEVLRSRSLARKTLERLKLLDRDPTRQSGQVGQFLGQLSVEPVRSDMGESRVVNLTVRMENPERAAQLANSLAQAYVDQNLDARRQGTRDASNSLNQRLDELLSAVNTSESALQRFREQKDSFSVGDQQNITVQKLGQINQSATAARTARLERQAVYQQLTAIKQSGAPLDTFNPIQTNSFIQGLKAELASLRKDRVQLSERLGDLHPDMVNVNTAIANAERRLSDEMQKVVDGVENDYKGAVATERELTAALEDQKREVLKLSEKSIEFGALQRDAASTQQMFEAVRQRVKETELAADLQSNNARILDVAEVPRAPVSPRSQLNLLIALFGGGLLSLGLAFGLEYFNPRITRPDDVAEALGLPVLGVAPQIPEWKNRPVTLDDLPPAFQEALRSIRTRIFLSPIAAAARCMAVTSSVPGEGKTLMATNLAISMATGGRRVLLVDADLRRPQQHRIFNMSRSPGLSDVMLGNVKIGAALVESPVTGLFVLAAGTHVKNPTDLLDSERLDQLIKGFNQVFDVVVLDSPPVMAVADASIIAHAASSVLFVVGSGSTSRDDAKVAIERLAGVQAQVVGVVLNKGKDDLGSPYHYQAYASDVA